MSKFQADQRKGRAGRESAGKCFRLFTEAAFDKLSVAPLPEVQRANLAQVILQLKVLGVASIESFSFLSPPADMALENAYKSLLMLGAISEVRVLQFFRLSPAVALFDYLLTPLRTKACLLTERGWHCSHWTLCFPTYCSKRMSSSAWVRH